MGVDLGPFPTRDVLDVTGKVAHFREPLVQWFKKLFIVAFDQQTSGTTAQRPTADLYVGKFYFDKDLGTEGRPIWRNKDNDGWCDADGNAV
jgi:hypothetical protein